MLHVPDARVHSRRRGVDERKPEVGVLDLPSCVCPPGTVFQCECVCLCLEQLAGGDRGRLSEVSSPRPLLQRENGAPGKTHCSQTGNGLNEMLVLKNPSKEIIQEPVIGYPCLGRASVGEPS